MTNWAVSETLKKFTFKYNSRKKLLCLRQLKKLNLNL